MSATQEKYKVWYIPQIPMPAFEREYTDLETAKAVMEAIIGFSIFEFDHRVKPDYSDAAGIARWEQNGDDDGYDWYDLEDDEAGL